MKLLKKYLLHTFSQTFFPIFFTLYVITSIVYLVKIAALTSIIQINFLELLTLYSFSIPTILFYTLPISSFISLILSISKLSNEYELIVITSFGLNPLRLIRLIFPIILLITTFLLINNLALVPKANFLNKSFIEKKKKEAQFNIKASEYGQQFDKWFLYVDEKKDELYNDIVLFKQEQNKDTIVIAKHATINNNKSSLSLNLQDGRVVEIKDKLSQVDFGTMIINNEIKQSKNINSIDDLILYWSDIFTNKNKMYRFNFAILIAILPLVSILYIISLGFYNPRYDKNYSTSIALALAVIYLLITKKVSNEFGIIALYSIPILWIISSYFAYLYKIKRYY
ncbi:MAG: LptF/LptG family permease [Campylobacterota bacterium]|nr:LptF/LptG family permease [Campylobacterota bacterium]